MEDSKDLFLSDLSRKGPNPQRRYINSDIGGIKQKVLGPDSRKNATIVGF